MVSKECNTSWKVKADIYLLTFQKDFIYLFLEGKGRGKEGESEEEEHQCEREASICCPSYALTRDQPATQARAPTGNQSGDLCFVG